MGGACKAAQCSTQATHRKGAIAVSCAQDVPSTVRDSQSKLHVRRDGFPDAPSAHVPHLPEAVHKQQGSLCCSSKAWLAVWRSGASYAVDLVSVVPVACTQALASHLKLPSRVRADQPLTVEQLDDCQVCNGVEWTHGGHLHHLMSPKNVVSLYIHVQSEHLEGELKAHLWARGGGGDGHKVHGHDAMCMHTSTREPGSTLEPWRVLTGPGLCL